MGISMNVYELINTNNTFLLLVHRKADYPNLSRMAIDYLIIPGMPVHCPKASPKANQYH